MCDNELSGYEMSGVVIATMCTGVLFSAVTVSVGGWVRSTVAFAGAVYSSVVVVGLLIIPVFLGSWAREGFRVEYLWEAHCLSPWHPDVVLLAMVGSLATKDVPWLLAGRQWALVLHHVLMVLYILYMILCPPPNGRILLAVGVLLESGSLVLNIAWLFHGQLYTADMYRIGMTASNIVSVVALVFYGLVCPLTWWDSIYLPVVSCIVLCHLRQKAMYTWYMTYQMTKVSECIVPRRSQ